MKTNIFLCMNLLTLIYKTCCGTTLGNYNNHISNLKYFDDLSKASLENNKRKILYNERKFREYEIDPFLNNDDINPEVPVNPYTTLVNYDLNKKEQYRPSIINTVPSPSLSVIPEINKQIFYEKPTFTEIETRIPNENYGIIETNKLCATDKPCTTNNPCTTEKPCKIEKPCTTEKPRTTEKPCTTEQPCTTDKPCQNQCDIEMKSDTIEQCKPQVLPPCLNEQLKPVGFIQKIKNKWHDAFHKTDSDNCDTQNDNNNNAGSVNNAELYINAAIKTSEGGNAGASGVTNSAAGPTTGTTANCEKYINNEAALADNEEQFEANEDLIENNNFIENEYPNDSDLYETVKRDTKSIDDSKAKSINDTKVKSMVDFKPKPLNIYKLITLKGSSKSSHKQNEQNIDKHILKDFSENDLNFMKTFINSLVEYKSHSLKNDKNTNNKLIGNKGVIINGTTTPTSKIRKCSSNNITNSSIDNSQWENITLHINLEIQNNSKERNNEIVKLLARKVHLPINFDEKMIKNNLIDIQNIIQDSKDFLSEKESQENDNPSEIDSNQISKDNEPTEVLQKDIGPSEVLPSDYIPINDELKGGPYVNLNYLTDLIQEKSKDIVSNNIVSRSIKSNSDKNLNNKKRDIDDNDYIDSNSFNENLDYDTDNAESITRNRKSTVDNDYDDNIYDKNNLNTEPKKIKKDVEEIFDDTNNNELLTADYDNNDDDKHMRNAYNIENLDIGETSNKLINNQNENLYDVDQNIKNQFEKDVLNYNQNDELKENENNDYQQNEYNPNYIQKPYKDSVISDSSNTISNKVHDNLSFHNYMLRPVIEQPRVYYKFQDVELDRASGKRKLKTRYRNDNKRNTEYNDYLTDDPLKTYKKERSDDNIYKDKDIDISLDNKADIDGTKDKHKNRKKGKIMKWVENKNFESLRLDNPKYNEISQRRHSIFPFNQQNEFSELGDFNGKLNLKQEETITNFIKNLNSPPQIFNFDVDKYINNKPEIRGAIPLIQNPPPQKAFYEFVSHSKDNEKVPFISTDQQEVTEDKRDSPKRDLLRQYIKGISAADTKYNSDYKSLVPENPSITPETSNQVEYDTNNIDLITDDNMVDNNLKNMIEATGINKIGSGGNYGNYFTDREINKYGQLKDIVKKENIEKDDFVDRYYLLNDGSFDVQPKKKVKSNENKELKYDPSSLEIDLDLDKKFRDLYGDMENRHYYDKKLIKTRKNVNN